MHVVNGQVKSLHPPQEKPLRQPTKKVNGKVEMPTWTNKVGALLKGEEVPQAQLPVNGFLPPSWLI